MKKNIQLIVLSAAVLLVTGPFVHAQDPEGTTINLERIERIRAKQKRLIAELAELNKQQDATATGASATSSASAGPMTFAQASGSIQTQLEDSLAELAGLRKKIAAEKIPLNKKLGELEGELVQLRLDYQQTSRQLDTRTLDLSNLRADIKTRKDEAAYLSNLLSEYARNFESSLHIAELQLYKTVLEKAKLAPENSNLSQEDIYRDQIELVNQSEIRISDALGGVKFNGKAVATSGEVKTGTFVLVGPMAFFRSEDGKDVGTIQQRLGSLEPNIIPFGNPEDAKAAAQMISSSDGKLPFDVTMGNANKVESTKETLFEHIKLGGPIMFPILGMGAASLSVALFKWLTLFTLRKPSKKRLKVLLHAVAQGDKVAAEKEAHAIGGPIGKMLSAGIEHLDSPLELIEEVMHEVVLTTKIKAQGFLPFIALTATCGPLLGLLGTVTGIITTFGLITVFGSGDPKTLSGGISEALVGTEFGLYVAIPSLLMHAFLNRKSKGFIDQMEKTGVAFINQISRTRLHAMSSRIQAVNEEVAGNNGKREWIP